MSVYQAIKIGGGKQRQSNIEALRLLSMLMVLNLHSFWGYSHGTGILQVLDFFRETTSICAVDAFIIISGYFGIRWKFKSFYNLLFQIAFYAFGVYLVATLLGYVDFSLKGLFSNGKCFYASWGFVTGYVLLYMVSPLLNAFVEKSSKKSLFLTIIALLLSIIFITRDSGYLYFAVLYLVGRFINKTNLAESTVCKASTAYWISTLLILCIVLLLFKSGMITTAEGMHNPFAYGYSSPLVILQAAFLFLAFARMKFQSKWINWAASSCFAIFLIHMHPAIKEIGYYSFTESLYNLPLMQHIGILLALILFVFIGSILIDKICIIISELVYSLLCFIKRLLPQKLFLAETYMTTSFKELIK